MSSVITAIVTVSETDEPKMLTENPALAYVVEVDAGPPVEDTVATVFYLETRSSPLVFQITGILFDSLRAQGIDFECRNSTALEL